MWQLTQSAWAAVASVFFPLFEQGLQDEIGAAVQLAIAVLVVLDRVTIPAQLFGLAERGRGFALWKALPDWVVEGAEVLVAGSQAILKARQARRSRFRACRSIDGRPRTRCPR